MKKGSRPRDIPAPYPARINAECRAKAPLGSAEGKHIVQNALSVLDKPGIVNGNTQLAQGNKHLYRALAVPVAPGGIAAPLVLHLAHRDIELGNEGVLLLMCESTNAERPGYTPSERLVGASLDSIFFRNADKRISIATFSSNVHRVQQIINTSEKYGRKVVINGRSMMNIVGCAMELGYMHAKEGTLIDITDIKKYNPEQLTIVCTGSQGEPMSSLYRMAFSDHSRIELSTNDVVVISANAIPGNEKLVNNIINELFRKGVSVIYDAVVSDVHVSGHACQEELKTMHALTKPKYFMPIHGEYKHLATHRNLALFLGEKPENIIPTNISYSSAFVRSVASASESMLHICGYVVFFSAMAEWGIKSGVIERISEAAEKIIPFAQKADITAMICGLFEASTGGLLSKNPIITAFICLSEGCRPYFRYPISFRASVFL